ncbi:DUF2919 domain-containing protein [Pseudoalteromonas fenneropenaei]|uniref:DUF2919 domain-containing protein n=1 Tax=Pseudoalteromonas fenneropenaei TaxID=1737459 RepID=A0ABV7CEB7_9GAMM
MRHFGPEYWDKYGVYRAPLGFNLTLVVLLRAYILWVIAAVTRQPELDLMSLFYSHKQHFFIALGIASIALIPAVVFSLRRPTASTKLAPLWRNMRWPLILCAVVDLAWLIWQAQQSHYQFSGYIAGQMLLVSWVLLYLVKSRYLRYFFNDWPDPEVTGSSKSQ